MLYADKAALENRTKVKLLAIREREEEIRMLDLQVAELCREIEVTRRKLPKIPELEPIDGKGRTYLLGVLEQDSNASDDSSNSGEDEKIFDIF